VFSGGAFFGLYHTGVASTLYKEGLLPKIISGSSVGSITAAFVGSSKKEKLEKYFSGSDGAVNYGAFL
jgi:predicted acylesterase/phospholipase RssA